MSEILGPRPPRQTVTKFPAIVTRKIVVGRGSRMSRLAVVSRADHERPRLHRGDAAEVGSVGVVEERLRDVRSARLDGEERAVGGAVHPHDGRVGDATVLDVVTIARACRGIERATMISVRMALFTGWRTAAGAL